jgi:hypothetical protein
MMHSATQLADTVISRSVYNRETTVKHLEHGGSYSRLGGKASIRVGVRGFERPHGWSLQCVSSPKWHISSYPQMKKFKPLSRHNVVISVAKAAIVSFIKIYTTYTTEEGLLI